MLFLRVEKSFHTNALAVRSRGTRVAHETAGGREGRHFRRLLLLSPLGEGERRVREGERRGRGGGAGGGGRGGNAGRAGDRGYRGAGEAHRTEGAGGGRRRGHRRRRHL